MHEAGFRDVERAPVPAPLRLPRAADCLRFERESFGALHQMLAGLSPPNATTAWQEIETELARFERPTASTAPAS